MIPLVKAHAYGNDFLYVDERAVADITDRPALARTLCERHRGVGADGLIVYRPCPGGASMQLLNADGSYSEVSGNGVRALAAVLLHAGQGVEPGAVVDIHTDAGVKRLSLLAHEGHRYQFRAAMGAPTDLRQQVLEVDGESLELVTMRVGNPQCIKLEAQLDEARMRRFGRVLEHHAAFPEGTNVEFVQVVSPERIRILIWERGVGPTEASGTGACGAAVAAAAFGGAGRDLLVASPGGEQRVEWTDEGLFLTGWAEVLYTAHWAIGVRS